MNPLSVATPGPSVQVVTFRGKVVSVLEAQYTWYFPFGVSTEAPQVASSIIWVGVVRRRWSYWVRSKEGRQRRDLQDWLRRLVDALGGRILGFNVPVAHVWADQEHLPEKQGKRMPVEDGYIAATARRHGLAIATGNDKDFRRPGLKVFNPFKELPPV